MDGARRTVGIGRRRKRQWSEAAKRVGTQPRVIGAWDTSNGLFTGKRAAFEPAGKCIGYSGPALEMRAMRFWKAHSHGCRVCFSVACSSHQLVGGVDKPGPRAGIPLLAFSASIHAARCTAIRRRRRGVRTTRMGGCVRSIGQQLRSKQSGSLGFRVQQQAFGFAGPCMGCVRLRHLFDDPTAFGSVWQPFPPCFLLATDLFRLRVRGGFAITKIQLRYIADRRSRTVQLFLSAARCSLSSSFVAAACLAFTQFHFRMASMLRRMSMVRCSMSATRPM